MNFLIISFACCFAVIQQSSAHNGDADKVIKLNKAIDNVLEFVHMAFSDEGFSIMLPDQTKQIGRPPYSGKFLASGGFFHDPASLHRTGDVKIVKHGTSISIIAALGLSVVDAGYDNYTIDILGIHQAGKVDISIDKNSLEMNITLTYAPKCEFKLGYLRFNELSGIKVNISGLGVFQTMFETLSTWFISNFETNLKTVVNKKLYEKVNKLLDKENFCKYFPQ